MKIDINVNDAGNEVKTYADAITFAGKVLVAKEDIDEGYIDACISRETDFPTGLLFPSGEGIAIPHGNSEFVKKDSISVVRTATPIEFGLMEDKAQKVQCQLIFNLALASGQQHLQILRKLVILFQDETFTNNFKSMNADEAVEYIKNYLIEE